MSINPIHPDHDGDSHLRPVAYYALAGLAGLIGLSASAVTIQLFAEAIRVTEPEGHARELLALTAALFVVAELAACFIAGLVPVRRLRALRWKLTACAVLLVAFEAVSLYGARVALLHAAEAQASASQGRAEALRARIEASRRNAAALLAAGEVSSRSVLASSRAEGARSIRDAAAMESETERLVAELAQVEAARVPTAATVFGQSGAVAMAVAQSLLISSIGLLFLGAAGALARAARDARATARADAVTATTDAPQTTAAASIDAPTPAAALIDAPTDAPQPQPVAAPQVQAAPKGIPPAVPTWGRYAALAAGAGAGLLVPYAAQAAAVQPQARAQATDAVSAPTEPMVPGDRCREGRIATPIDAPVDTPSAVATPTATPAATPAATVAGDPGEVDTPIDAVTTTAADAAPTGIRDDERVRFLRVKDGVEAGRIKPSIRAIYAAEGASQAVARRYLVELERTGIIELAGKGKGKGYRLTSA